GKRLRRAQIASRARGGGIDQQEIETARTEDLDRLIEREVLRDVWRGRRRRLLATTRRVGGTHEQQDGEERSQPHGLASCHVRPGGQGAATFGKGNASSEIRSDIEDSTMAGRGEGP